jgi:CRP-like cAMP-binding protein
MEEFVSDARNNLLLAALEARDYEVLRLAGKVISVKFRKRLYHQEEAIQFVYFPITCMVSLLVSDKGGDSIAMATIGREGVIGAAETIQRQGRMGLSVVQLPGTAFQIEASAFLKIANSRPPIRDLMYRHLHALLRQVLFGAACNGIHSMEQRCSRWLLMTHDRSDADNFPLTQENLSHMLGVRRATVNVAIGKLTKAGFISHLRGRITILDRHGLESAACHCYQAIVGAYRSILPVSEFKKSVM